jgi:hypothetical protein
MLSNLRLALLRGDKSWGIERADQERLPCSACA